MFIDTTSEVASRVTGAIRQAAAATGAGFEYLLKTAVRESNLDPSLRASTSSATGLFQFIDQTWLATMKESGAAYGYGPYADAISKTSSGRYVVSDPAMYRQIMALRKDPAANAVMAGAFTNRNAAELSEGLGRKPTDGELYIAHFLGPAGAVRFIKAAANTPSAKAAAGFPDAARANRNIFYHRIGAPKTYAQVYQGLVSKHDSSKALVASAPPAGASTASAGAATDATTPVSAAISAASRGATEATEAAAAESKVAAGPVFHGLFRSAGQPVSSAVRSLWGTKEAGVQLASAVPPVASAEAAAPVRRLGAPLDLFQFLRPEIRSLAQRT